MKTVFGTNIMHALYLSEFRRKSEECQKNFDFWTTQFPSKIGKYCGLFLLLSFTMLSILKKVFCTIIVIVILTNIWDNYCRIDFPFDDNGIVVGNGYSGRGGKYVRLLSLDLKVYYFAHLSKSNVHVGQIIKSKQLIGFMVDTGNAKYSPFHLHFSIFSPSASQEYTAAIIYHEVLHAYFQTWGGLMTSSYQHEYMASEYTNRLTAALMSMFPGFDQADANALAWSGLHNTPYWNNLKSPAQRADILSRVDSFTNGTKGNKCN